jgi:hypothetical protein
MQLAGKPPSLLLLSLDQLACQESKGFTRPLAFHCDSGNDVLDILSQEVQLQLALLLACQRQFSA